VGVGATSILARYGTGYIPGWRAIALFSASGHPFHLADLSTRVPGVPAFHASALPHGVCRPRRSPAPGQTPACGRLAPNDTESHFCQSFRPAINGLPDVITGCVFNAHRR